MRIRLMKYTELPGSNGYGIMPMVNSTVLYTGKLL